MNIKKAIYCLGVAGFLTGCTHAAFNNPPAQAQMASAVPAPAIPVQTQPLANNGSLQTGRYQTTPIGAAPAQINPLLTVATFRFAPAVQTVGQAIHQVLQYSGYALASAPSPDIQNTLSQPLPYSVRVLGPIQIQDALTVLMGQNVFTLVIDPLHRLVSFAVKPQIATALSVSRHAGGLFAN